MGCSDSKEAVPPRRGAAPGQAQAPAVNAAHSSAQPHEKDTTPAAGVTAGSRPSAGSNSSVGYANASGGSGAGDGDGEGCGADRVGTSAVDPTVRGACSSTATLPQVASARGGPRSRAQNTSFNSATTQAARSSVAASGRTGSTHPRRTPSPPTSTEASPVALPPHPQGRGGGGFAAQQQPFSPGMPAQPPPPEPKTRVDRLHAGVPASPPRKNRSGSAVARRAAGERDASPSPATAGGAGGGGGSFATRRMDSGASSLRSGSPGGKHGSRPGWNSSTNPNHTLEDAGYGHLAKTAKPAPARERVSTRTRSAAAAAGRDRSDSSDDAHAGTYPMATRKQQQQQQQRAGGNHVGSATHAAPERHGSHSPPTGSGGVSRAYGSLGQGRAPSAAVTNNSGNRTSNAGARRGGGGGRKGKAGGNANASVDDRLKDLDLTDEERRIASEIVDFSPDVRFDDVAGLEQVKSILHEIIIAPTLNPALFKGLRAPCKGVLLFGPPGNGKTLIAKAVVTECKMAFFNISASSITSKFVGESEKHIRNLFSLARKLQPCVIFIDEIDSMLTSRKSSEHDASRRLKTEFLVQMDGVGSNKDDRILVLGATNRPFELDDAALRRMPKRVYIPLPDVDTREGLIAHKLAGEKTDLTARDVARLTDGYSCSDMACLCSEAAMYPIRDLPKRDLTTVDPADVRPIALADFKEAMRVIRPSVDKATLNTCVEWNRQFGAGAS